MPYVQTREQQARDYRPRYPVGYTPRPDPLVALDRAVKAQPAPRPWLDDPKPDHRVSPQAAAKVPKPIQPIKPTTATQVLEIMRVDPREWTARELTDRLGCSRALVSVTLFNLSGRGRVVCLPDPARANGVCYRIADAWRAE